MKFSGLIEDGTSNMPLNFGSKLLPCRRFALSECTLLSEDLHSRSAASLLMHYLFCTAEVDHLNLKLGLLTNRWLKP